MEKYLNLKNKIDYKKLKNPAEIIKQGGIVVFPTETVYGIGANGLDEKAVEKIYIAKNRDRKNPINLLVSDMEMIKRVAKNITEIEEKLMQTFFPGPFTIILEKKEIVPDIVTANKKYVGIRMPKGEIARKLVEYAGVPIAAPSANISTKLSGTEFDDIYHDFKDKVDFMIDGGKSNIGIESTIVKVIDDVPHILRPGSITYEQIVEITGSAIKDYEDKNSSNINTDKHYNTNSKCVLIYSKDNQKMLSKINEMTADYKNVIVLATSQNFDKYIAKNVIDIGDKNDFGEIGKNIFSKLREADKFNPDIVIIEGIEQKGLGIAIMNRLIKACDYNFIELE